MVGQVYFAHVKVERDHLEKEPAFEYVYPSNQSKLFCDKLVHYTPSPSHEVLYHKGKGILGKINLCAILHFKKKV